MLGASQNRSGESLNGSSICSIALYRFKTFGFPQATGWRSCATTSRDSTPSASTTSIGSYSCSATATLTTFRFSTITKRKR